MRIAICQLPPGGSILAQTSREGRVFSRGDRVDLDAVAGTRPVDTAEGTPGEIEVTWGDVLGHHVADHFVIETAGEASPAQEE